MSLSLNVHLTYPGFRLDAELELPAHGVSAVLGPSGCGKTSLLRAVAGLEQHGGTRIKIGSETWQDDTLFMPVHERRLGMVFQEANLFPHFNVQHNIEYGYKRLPEKNRRIALKEVIGLLGLENLLHRKPDRLSGGERQRTAIARALAVSPELLLMDEPLASLDNDRKNDLLPYIRNIATSLKVPVLYVTHSIDEAARIADHVILLGEGKVCASGPIQEVLTNLELPLVNDPEAEAVIEAVAEGYDEAYGLVQLRFPGGIFTVPGPRLPKDQDVRLRIHARDVSITLAPQENTSILNIFEASVDELATASPDLITVRLRAGTVPLLARITRKSCDQLKLEPGKKVYAQVKSVSLLT